MNVKDIKEDRSRALSLAGAAIVSALLDTLVEKNVLTVREVRAVLLKAMHGLSPSLRADPRGLPSQRHDRHHHA
jgi:hypothetical protein